VELTMFDRNGVPAMHFETISLVHFSEGFWEYFALVRESLLHSLPVMTSRGALTFS